MEQNVAADMDGVVARLGMGLISVQVNFSLEMTKIDDHKEKENLFFSCQPSHRARPRLP